MEPRCLLFLLSCTICFVRHAEGARILGIFPLQGKSHFLMFQEVTKALADAGHQIDVVSHFPQQKPYPNYTDIIDLSDKLPTFVNNFSYEQIKAISLTSFKLIVDMVGNEICSLLESPELQRFIKSPPTDPPYDLILVEFFFASCYFAFGRHLNVPVVGLSSSAMLPHVNAPLGNPFNPAIVSEIAERPASHMNFLQRLKNTVVTYYGIAAFKYYMSEQNKVVKKHFGPEMPDIGQLEREMSLLLVNSHSIFHGLRPFTPAVVEVAGVHVRDDDTPLPKELQKWLDDSKDGVIYFSLGSMYRIETFPKTTITEIYSAFAKIAPIRVLMKVARPNDLPPGLPDNVMTLTWAPQVQVLKHKNTRGFLTHGGLMGLQEAVTFAVPLIGMPLLGDQIGNIHICVDREIAVSLDYDNLKADDVVAAVNAIVHDPKYKNNVKALSKQFLDRPRNARDTAVFWIEYILKYGGDTLRSPAVKLSWWQVELLDVYGSIIAAILTVLYVLKVLLSKILGRILNQVRATTPSKKRN